MRKVLVIGSSGAGKSVFAARLAERTGLPLIHLDAVYWRPGWIKTPKDEWVRTVDRLLARPRWVMDGNYSGTLDRRIAACDTVVFLDLPRAVCLWRVARRLIVYRHGARPDMTPGCSERLTGEFIRWIWEYPRKQRPRVLEKLAALRPDQRAVILRSGAEVDDFLRTAPPRPGVSDRVRILDPATGPPRDRVATRYLILPYIRSALNRGEPVGQFLGGFVVDGHPAIRWVLLQKGAHDDDFDDGGDAGEIEDAGDDVFVLSYYEVLDEGDEKWADVYDFSAASGDPDDNGEPAARHRVPTLDEALALARERYGADPGRFVSETMIEHEYYDYVVRGRR